MNNLLGENGSRDPVWTEVYPLWRYMAFAFASSALTLLTIVESPYFLLGSALCVGLVVDSFAAIASIEALGGPVVRLQRIYLRNVSRGRLVSLVVLGLLAIAGVLCGVVASRVIAVVILVVGGLSVTSLWQYSLKRARGMSRVWQVPR